MTCDPANAGKVLPCNVFFMKFTGQNALSKQEEWPLSKRDYNMCKRMQNISLAIGHKFWFIWLAKLQQKEYMEKLKDF